MKVIGIESSSLVASVAIVEEDTLTAEYTVNHKKTHSQTLLPMLAEICRMAECEVGDADAIAVAAGPGSFTGLRIGAATAKGLGFVTEKPLIAVPTLDAMAYGLWGCDALICPILDARRNQVYGGIYRFEDRQRFTVVKPGEAMAIEELLAELAELPGRVMFLGDGVPVFRSTIEKALGGRALFAPAPQNRQRAALVAALGLEMLKRGETVSAAALAPDYHRMSQAERCKATGEKN